MQERPDKAVLTAERRCEPRAGLFKCQKGLENSFDHCGSPMKLVHTCSSTRKELESCFHHCGVPVKLVQVCSCAVRPYKVVLPAEEVL